MQKKSLHRNNQEYMDLGYFGAMHPYNPLSNQEMYIGLTENEFKTRFNLHMSSFKLEHRATTLSDHARKKHKKKKKQPKNIDFNIKWKIAKKVKPFAPDEKVCKLCVQEKLSILRSRHL